MTPIVWGGRTVACEDPKCSRSIVEGDSAFYDDEGLYCDSCGKCRRYERKKAEQRRAHAGA